MKPSEVPQLLAEIALADPRVRRDDPLERRAQIAMWAGILTDVPYDFAVTAIHRHYAASQWPILPANISTAWTATVRDRMERHTGTFEPTAHPHLDPDDIAGYQAALAAERQAVAAGHTPPVDVRELTGAPAAEVQARLDRLGTYMPRQIGEQLADLRPVRRERERLATAGLPDPLDVACGWCDARAGEACQSRGIRPGNGPVVNRRRNKPHPSRVDAATATHARTQGATQ